MRLSAHLINIFLVLLLTTFGCSLATLHSPKTLSPGQFAVGAGIGGTSANPQLSQSRAPEEKPTLRESTNFSLLNVFASGRYGLWESTDVGMRLFYDGPLYHRWEYDGSYATGLHVDAKQVLYEKNGLYLSGVLGGSAGYAMDEWHGVPFISVEPVVLFGSELTYAGIKAQGVVWGLFAGGVFAGHTFRGPVDTTLEFGVYYGSNDALAVVPAIGVSKRL